MAGAKPFSALCMFYTTSSDSREIIALRLDTVTKTHCGFAACWPLNYSRKNKTKKIKGGKLEWIGSVFPLWLSRSPNKLIEIALKQVEHTGWHEVTHSIRMIPLVWFRRRDSLSGGAGTNDAAQNNQKSSVRHHTDNCTCLVVLPSTLRKPIPEREQELTLRLRHAYEPGIYSVGFFLRTRWVMSPIYCGCNLYTHWQSA